MSCGMLGCLALCANAQTPGPQPSDPPAKRVENVTVTAPASIDAIVSQFIGTHAARDRKTGQFVRETDLGICPVTLGLSPAFNAFVTARVRTVAAEIGARLQPSAACTPNVEILFSGEAQAVVDRLVETSRGAFLGPHFVHEIAPLSKMTHPVQAWYMTGTRAEDTTGDSVSSSDKTMPFAGRYALDNAYHGAPERRILGSRLDMRIQSAIVNVLIVADTQKLQRAEIGPLSDYIALLTFTQPHSLDDCNALPSILDLMSAGCGARDKPKSLTDSDMIYLKTLYAADLAARAVPQEHNLTRDMTGALDQPGK